MCECYGALYLIFILFLSGTVIYKMLHPENVMSLRFYGIKLLILFMLDVQEHVDDACLELFATAVPQFPPPLVPEVTDGEEIIVGSTSSVVNRYGPYCSEETSKWWDLSPGLGELVCLLVWAWSVYLCVGVVYLLVWAWSIYLCGLWCKCLYWLCR